MNRTPRKVEIADPLWTALETMSREMGVDRDVLVNQAVFSLARQFGFIQPTQISLTDAVAVAAPAPVARPVAVVAPVPVEPVPVEAKPAASEGTPPSVEVAERVRELVRDVEQKVEPKPAPAPVELADAEEDESKTGEHEGAPVVDEAAASDVAPEESTAAVVAEAPVDVEALRAAVADRVRDLVRDADQWVEPVDAKPEVDSDEEDSDEDSDDEDSDDDSDEEASDDDANDADSDSDDDSDDADSDDESSDDDSADADDEDSDDEEARASDEAASGEDSDDQAADESSGDSDDEASGDEDEDTGEVAAASAAPALADEDSSELVTQAKDERKSGAGVRPDKTIIVQAPPELKVTVKLDEGEPVLVARERFIIGRGPSADLMVKSARVSREHAAILRDGDDVFIEDLKSSNGTWFDNTRISRRQVADGEEYLLGGIRITFSLTT
ncbi:FHA domain-containing protein [Myxococcus qinghaiensis]|uniref:FHA domain-containing protein n=1 Tax=Myxococcus qinghaiensis TaxID=2906758 RepID=UPI0020A8058F|nr:FHA domain-containing protein [Myxococcus qinghaiensis]MCP3163687.1 FHA domain-containing protein [Myxococcus qinghaiensis]